MDKRMIDVLDTIRSAEWYGGQVKHVVNIPKREGIYCPIPLEVHEKVRDFLNNEGISLLFSHQSEIFHHRDQDLVVSTSTASGKTIGFLLPVLDNLARDEDACALFIYPLKALANDQLLVFERADKVTGIGMFPSIYDGDTPKAKRPRIRQQSRVILSNPYEVHEILSHNYQWRRFFSNLKYIVIDEAHRYTGVFGSNVAQVIRRLLRIVQSFGADPNFILASASIGNPKEHAYLLTSRDCKVISDDGSPLSERTLLFFDTCACPERSGFTQTKDVFIHLIKQGLKTLCFTVSRKGAEFIASLASESAPNISPYRAGYLPEERRRIEYDLRKGALMGIVSTNALELGIDIGDLDAVVIAGFPGSISAFWQEAGRAGRRGKSALVIYVAFETILDQYLMKHPEVIIERKWERANIDLQNEYILAGHMLCAASEMPLNPKGAHEEAVVEGLERKGLIHRTPMGYTYMGVVRPQEAIKLDRMSDIEISLINVENGELLETMDIDRALKEVFPGAVYLHQAKTWIVEELDLKGLVAKLKCKDVKYYTQPLVNKVGEIVETKVQRDGKSYAWAWGKIKITQKVTGYLIKMFDKVVGGKELQLPERTFETTSIWIDVNGSVRRSLGQLHALEHAIVGIAPIILSCDPSDLGGFSTENAPHSGKPAIFIYDGYPGGIGLSEKIFLQFSFIIATARDVLKGCKCENGCLSCCLSPMCGNDNQPMDKKGALEMSECLLEESNFL